MSRKKKTIKKKRSHFRKDHCSPKKSGSSISCIDQNLLLKVVDILNNHINANIKKENNHKLHEEISDKISEISDCDSEKCWSSIHEIVNNLTESELEQFKSSFKPRMPSKWKQNPTTWLTTSDIENCLKQYEGKHKNFKCYGALPMDFDLKNNNSCVSGDLCNINIRRHLENDECCIGTVFNLDDHDEPGSHWTAMYVELLPRCREKPSAYYFDSVGSKPPKEIKALVDKLQDQHQSIKGTQLDFLYNDIQHQKENTECGIYALHFLETMLKGMDFEKYIENKNSDKYMENFRNYYFIDE